TLDWKDVQGEDVDPTKHDIGLVILDQALSIDKYPEIAKVPLADGAQVVNIGRIKNGRLSNTALYVSQPVTLTDATQIGFPYDYTTDDVIEPGDSGGPDEVPNSPTHLITSVNSGGGQATEVLARVDLVYAFIQSTIAANGGGGFAGATAADAGTDAPST